MLDNIHCHHIPITHSHARSSPPPATVTVASRTQTFYHYHHHHPLAHKAIPPLSFHRPPAHSITVIPSSHIEALQQSPITTTFPAPNPRHYSPAHSLLHHQHYHPTIRLLLTTIPLPLTATPPLPALPPPLPSTIPRVVASRTRH